MAKDERSKLARKLAKAQLKLREADEGVAATRIEGEQAVQRARLKAEKELARARRELARRVEKVARLENELHGDDRDGRSNAVTTAGDAADVLERLGESQPTEDVLIVEPF